MHHFERPYLKPALIDVIALFLWGGSFGIASASAMFHRTIESVLRGILCTLVRADNLSVWGHSDEKTLANVEKVLARLANAGLKAKRRKCRMI